MATAEGDEGELPTLDERLVVDIRNSTKTWFEKTTWAPMLLQAMQHPEIPLDPERFKVSQDELLFSFMVLSQIEAFRYQWRGTKMSDEEAMYAVATMTMVNKQAQAISKQHAKRMIADAKRKRRRRGATRTTDVSIVDDGSLVANASQCSQAFEVSYYNHSQILQSGVCGCYECLETFPPEEIKEWDEDHGKPKRENTAICPYCGLDSVIGSKCGLPIETPSFLKSIGAAIKATAASMDLEQ